MGRYRIFIILIAFVLLVGTAATVQGADVNLLQNGDFETGDLTGWTASGLNGGFAFTVTEGTSFSGGSDTTTIEMNGNHAANVRSSGPAPTNSWGILTSAAFTPGDESDTLEWKQLSEKSDVYIELQILNDAGVVLETNQITPATSNWATQSFSLTPYIGTSIKVQFRQHTTQSGLGWYTLLDDIITKDAPSATSGTSDIPEFPTIAIPIAAIIGMMFLIGRKKE